MQILSLTVRVALCLAFLSPTMGCTDLLSKPDPLRIIILNEAAPAAPLCSSPMPMQLVVALPEPYAGLDGERIALLLDEREVRYVSGYRWDAPAPFLAQRALVEALNGSGCFSGVGVGSDGMNAPYRLSAQIRRMHFKQDAGLHPYAVRVELSLALLNGINGKIMGRHISYAERQGDYTEPYALGAGMEQALRQTALDAAAWCWGVLKGSSYH